mmetsp:Transcript_74111/g.149329  ORF Transcript_74111/g.149329 Transcript_74111/m.149329 type:complete len:92 (-) Transcript_74111:593-868(-)
MSSPRLMAKVANHAQAAAAARVKMMRRPPLTCFGGSKAGRPADSSSMPTSARAHVQVKMTWGESGVASRVMHDIGVVRVAKKVKRAKFEHM